LKKRRSIFSLIKMSNMDEELLQLDLDIQEDTIIKVMGVGGGGCNAVNYMHRQGIRGVSFLVCNTDKQVLGKSSVPAKLQLGPGLGAGGDPEKAREYAQANRDHIREALNDGTQMLFITAGMGGGTGTGASAIIAEVAQEMNILTVGIVTIPFAFEGKKKIDKAMAGVNNLAEHVDALLVINNEKLKQIYPDLSFFNAFYKSDDVVCNAAKAIAEIITVPGYINTDFADVYNTLKNGHIAIMNVGQASGENRFRRAITNALQSPLVTNDVHGAKRILLQFYCSTEHAFIMQEIDQINEFIAEVGEDVEVNWGISVDESLGEEVRVTLIATGYEIQTEQTAEAHYQPEPPKPVTEQQKEQPAAEQQPATEVQPATEQQPAAEVQTEMTIEQAPHQEPKITATSADEIVIELDDERPISDPKPRSGGFAGWMRGRRG